MRTLIHAGGLREFLVEFIFVYNYVGITIKYNLLVDFSFK